MSELNKAIDILNNEDVVAIPTETVYGLAGKIDSKKAINKIFQIKERPFFDPLIVHVSSIDMAKKLTLDFPPIASELAKKFWPGPLTIILDKNDKVSDLITSGLPRVGIRMPDNSLTLKLIEEINTPLAAPSANKFKKTSPTSKEHVNDEFGDEVYVLDDGESQVGIESTVIGVFNDHIEIYRPGMISKEDIQKLLPNINVEYKESPVAPGQLNHHYMPTKALTIADESFEITDEYAVWKLENNPELAARNLYSKLRQLDKSDKEKILFILNKKFKNDDKWLGILNRLKKAKTEDLYF